MRGVPNVPSPNRTCPKCKRPAESGHTHCCMRCRSTDGRDHGRNCTGNTCPRRAPPSSAVAVNPQQVPPELSTTWQMPYSTYRPSPTWTARVAKIFDNSSTGSSLMDRTFQTRNGRFLNGPSATLTGPVQLYLFRCPLTSTSQAASSIVISLMLGGSMIWQWSLGSTIKSSGKFACPFISLPSFATQ